MNVLASAIALLVVGTFTLCLSAGCSIEAKASEVICVKDQTDTCTNCERPKGDTRPYRGQHTCAPDGKSFGACGQCVPVEGRAGASQTDDDPSADETRARAPDTSSLEKTGDPEPSETPSCAALKKCCETIEANAYDPAPCNGVANANKDADCLHTLGRYRDQDDCS